MKFAQNMKDAFQNSILKSLATLIVLLIWMNVSMAATATLAASTSGSLASATNWSGGDNGGLPDANDNIVIALGARLTLTADFTTTGTVTFTAGTPTRDSQLNLAGFTLNSGAVTFGNPNGGFGFLIDVGSGTLNVTGDLTMGNPSGEVETISISSGTLSISGTLVSSGSGGENVVTMGSGLLQIGVTMENGITWTAGTGTVEYNVNGAGTIRHNYAYYNLKVSAGTKTTSNSTTVNNNLDITGGTMVMGGADNLTVTGTTILNGGNLSVTSSGTGDFGDRLTVTSGSFTTSSTYGLTFRNGITNNGTFNAAGTGAVSFATGNPQTILGSGAITFAGDITIGNGILVQHQNTNAVSGVTMNGVLNGSNGTSEWRNDLSTSLLNYAPSASTRPMNTGVFTASTAGNTVNYSSSGTQAQDVKGGTYSNLIISGGTGARTVVAADINVTGNLTIATGSLTPATFNMTVTGTTDITGSFLDAGAGGANIFVGRVTVNGAGTFNPTNNTSTLEFRGGITNDGVFTAAGSGAVSFTTNSRTILGSGAMSFAGAITIGNGIVIQHQNTNASGITITGSLTGGNGTSEFVNDLSTSVLNYAPAASTARPMATGLLTATTSGNTVNYSKAGNQDIKTTTYSNLTISGSGVKLALGNVSVTGNLLVSAGTLDLGTVATTADVTGTATITGTFDFNGSPTKTVTIGGNLSGAGTIEMSTAVVQAHVLNLGGATNAIGTCNFGATNQVVNYNRLGDQTVFGSTTYRRLIISGSGTKTMSAAVTTVLDADIQAGTFETAGFNFRVTTTTNVSGTLSDATTAGNNRYTGRLTINSGGTFSVTQASSINFRGGITNNGTFTQSGAGTVTFQTNTPQTILGDQPMTFTGAISIANGIVVQHQNTNAVSGITMNGVLDGGDAFSEFRNDLSTSILNYAPTASTRPMNTGVLTASTPGNTVNYSRGGAGAQDVKGGTYSNLIISNGSGARTVVAADLNVTGNLTIATGSLTPATFNMTVTGTTDITGSFLDAGAGGANIFVDRVTVNGAGTFNPTNNTSTLEFRGGITNDGTFTAAGSGAVSFTTNSRTILGSGAMSFAGAITLGNGIIIQHQNTSASGITITGSLTGSNGFSEFVNDLATSVLKYAPAAATARPMVTGLLTATTAGNTVHYSKGGAQDIKMTNYSNLTISGSGIKTALGNLVVGGDLLISAGTLDLGTVATTADVTGTATVTGTLDFNTAPAKTMTITGNLSGAGTITMATAAVQAHILNLGGATNTIGTYTSGATSQTINYTRSGDQTVFSSANYRNLTLSGSGTKTMSGIVTLAEQLNLSTACFLDVNGSTLTINAWDNGDMGTLGTDRCIVLGSTGTLAINGVGNGETANFLVGYSSTSTDFARVDIANSDPSVTASHTNFSYTLCDYVNNLGTCAGGVEVTTEGIDYSYFITSACTSATVTLYWDASKELSLTRSDIQMSHFTGGYWTTIGTAGAASNLSGSIYYYSAATTSFSPFGIGRAGRALPVELLSFFAKKLEKTVVLDWITATEINSRHFEVERSEDNETYFPIGYVRSQKENSNEKLSYQFVDEAPVHGLNYYRLKQVDIDGKYEYLPLEVVLFEEEQPSSFDVYPNPITLHHPINIKSIHRFLPHEQVLVVLIDLHGREYYSKVIITGDDGSFLEAIDVMDRIPSGTYIIKASDGAEMESKVVVVQ